MKGDGFFSAVFGITLIELSYWNIEREEIIFGSFGTSLDELSGINYNFESLWDFRCSENNGAIGDYPFQVDQHFNLWTLEYANNKYGAFFLDYVFKMRAGYSGLDLRKIDNWDETKEKSWKRICLPPMKLKLSSQVTNIIKKIITLANHNYEPYFIKPKDVPSEEEAIFEEISILKKYLPTRQTNIFVQNFEIELENDFNCPIQMKIIDLEFIQCEIMYPLSFVKAVSNYPKVIILRAA